MFARSVGLAASCSRKSTAALAKCIGKAPTKSRLVQSSSSRSQETATRSFHSGRSAQGCCHWFEPTDYGDSVWQVESNRLKYGVGALNEVGADANYLGLQKGARTVLFTDRHLRSFPHVERVATSLKLAGLDVVIYDELMVEPNDASFKAAIQFCIEGKFDGFVSVGGGSVIDTCKAANLYSTYPTSDFLKYVNAPIGKGAQVPGKLKPHISCPTTAGTGSESTGIAIFDLVEMHAKTGMVSPRMKPDLAVVDPSVCMTMTGEITACSGFDVLSHAIESFTARPFTKRPKPDHPTKRPLSQGSNPFSDIGCIEAIRLCGEFLPRAVNDGSDVEARERMMFASTLAGIAFGNVGCHLPHGLSYSVAGNAHETGYVPKGYNCGGKAMVPHGMSVILNAPSVFKHVADACPERALGAAEALGADVRGCNPESGQETGEVLSKRIIELMKVTHMPNGLNGVGYTSKDTPELTKGAMPQRRLLDNAPKLLDEKGVAAIYDDAMTYW